RSAVDALAGAGGGITGVDAFAADPVAVGPEETSLSGCCWHAVVAMTANPAIRQRSVSDFMDRGARRKPGASLGGATLSNYFFGIIRDRCTTSVGANVNSANRRILERPSTVWLFTKRATFLSCLHGSTASQSVAPLRGAHDELA